jgi:hypothetical protein
MSLDRRSLTKVIWNGVLAGLALLAIALLVRYQAVQSPLYDTSRAYVESMERAFRQVESGAAEPADFRDATDGFAGFELPEANMEGLIGEFAGRCYTVWRRPGVGAGAGLVSAPLSCAADPRLEFSQSYAEQVAVVPSSGVESTPIEWDTLLPPSRTPGWFVLVISLLVWLAFNSFVSITLVMYRRRRKT